MSLVNFLGGQLRNIAMRHDSGNAIMGASQTRLNMLGNSFGSSPENALNIEKQLASDSLIKGTQYKIASQLEEGAPEALDKHIKRSFRYLA